MQMVQNPWGVTVHGAASVKAIPDLVRIKFEVNRLEQEPGKAFAVANEAVIRVRQVLREHGVPDAAVERSRLSLVSAWTNRYASDRKFLGYQCKASFSVQSRDLDGVQQLLVDLVAAGANEIESVEFDVVAKPELRADARREAVAAARRKAELYAEAAGIRLGPVIHVDDQDPERLGMERGHGGGGAASDEALAPGHVVVSAAVVLGFAIAHD
jgi:uncharacterized protein YggE